MGAVMKTERYYLREIFPVLGNNGCNAYVDCYLPDKMHGIQLDTEQYPCLVICPGGAYMLVSERESEAMALKFISEGYRIFVLHYSVAPHRFPQQLLEVAGVVELIHQNVKVWCCDPDDIAIMGFSAGGHLACQYSNRYDCPEIREVLPNSKPVQKAILSYSVLTAKEPFVHRGSMENLLGHEPISPDEKGCSCELLVTEHTPPTFLWHTAEDRDVPVENSLLYAGALAAAKVPFELHVYPYGGHGLCTVDELTCVGLSERERYAHRWIGDCKKWLKLMSS